MTPRKALSTAALSAGEVDQFRLMLEAAERSDGRPSVGPVDHLLEALRAVHGQDGRPDIAPETIPRPGASSKADSAASRHPMRASVAVRSRTQGETKMKSILFTAAIISLASATAAQAEIICTQHGGCRETGKRIISGDGGGVNSQQSLTSHRTPSQRKCELSEPTTTTNERAHERGSTWAVSRCTCSKRARPFET
jgi:hypothetical protein